MKKYCLLLFVLLIGTVAANAQCDKKFKLTPERIYQVNEDGSEGEAIPFTAEITISKDSIAVVFTMPDGNSGEIRGKHTETVCKMNADYTEGTIEYKTSAQMLRNGEERPMNMLFTIESKAGKLSVFGVPVDQPNEKICFVIKDKQEIK
ncbi:MAG: hypothetical protein H7Y31_05190 [Chitinophagaceae bacterium]|nr:hypothetical protein [Chitinophagaceae bacterium]